MSALLLLGAGELGSRVGARWIARGGICHAITATPRRHAGLKRIGIEPSTQLIIPESCRHGAVLLSVAGSQNQLSVIRQLESLNASFRRAVLCSTTGVYDPPLEVLHEGSPLGTSARAQAAREAEQAFLGWAGEMGVMLRFGGLYRRGRGPVSALIRTEAPRMGPPDRVLGLIHYDDAAEATVQALSRDSVRPLYLAVTPPCPTRKEFYTEACARHRLPPPKFGAPIGGAGGGYDVNPLRTELLPELQWPDWRSALD